MTNAQWALVFETLTPVVYLATIALLVTILIEAKAVLVPVALAILLTFVLAGSKPFFEVFFEHLPGHFARLLYLIVSPPFVGFPPEVIGYQEYLLLIFHA